MSEAKKSRTALKIILPILILLVGGVAFIMLGSLKQAPERQRAPQQGALVEVLELRATSHQVTVYANGTVAAEQEIALVPEVSGKVVWISPRLVTGGIVKQGEKLLEIDSADYQLAVERARAEIARAEVALRTEQEKARVAKLEWDRIDLPDKGQPGPLVTREIQLQQERANLAAAQANLRQAHLNLARTTLIAPFAGRIRQEQVDIGQYLRAGSSIATLAGIARAEIHAPLPLNELSWLTIPRTNSGASGSPATITLPGNPQAEWRGKIIRSLGEINPQSRMATVIIQVEDPYQTTAEQEEPILHHGQFVEIKLHGQRLDQIISIPRSALRSGQQVWLADQQNRLQRQPVKVLRREKQQLLISDGLQSGDRLVLTTLSGPADGLLLRPVVQEQQQ